MQIRPAIPADLDAIAAYNAAMALETEHLELDLERLRARVKARRLPSRSLLLLLALASCTREPVVESLLEIHSADSWGSAFELEGVRTGKDLVFPNPEVAIDSARGLYLLRNGLSKGAPRRGPYQEYAPGIYAFDPNGLRFFQLSDDDAQTALEASLDWRLCRWQSSGNPRPTPELVPAGEECAEFQALPSGRYAVISSGDGPVGMPFMGRGGCMGQSYQQTYDFEVNAIVGDLVRLPMRLVNPWGISCPVPDERFIVHYEAGGARKLVFVPTGVFVDIAK
jgi:hypothetical protein